MKNKFKLLLNPGCSVRPVAGEALFVTAIIAAQSRRYTLCKSLAGCLLLAAGIAASTQTAFSQAHGHLDIGAVGTNQNDPLNFNNGAIFSTNTGYIKTLTFTNSGIYAGYYQGNITLTGLAATPAHSGPIPGASAPGSMIYAQIVSVAGPAGGAFGFWETGATAPTISLFSGTTGTNTYKVSENDGSAGSDPYGHYHGRKFTATVPGIYLVGFRALDFSTNGVGGGPIHAPSDVLKFYFQAGINIASITKSGNISSVEFGSMAGQIFNLEYSSSLTNLNWTAIGEAVAGNDSLQTLTDNDATDSQRFYRIKATTPEL